MIYFITIVGLILFTGMMYLGIDPVLKARKFDPK